MSDGFEFGGDVAWRPTPEYVQHSRLTAFMDRHGVRSYAELLTRSTTDVEWFWGAVLDDLGIEFYEPYARVVDTSRGIAWPRWCVGGRLNIVHNCIDKWIRTAHETRPALRWEGEEGVTRTLTYRELFHEVNRCANALREIGVAKGDRVAMHNSVEVRYPFLDEDVFDLYEGCRDYRSYTWHRHEPTAGCVLLTYGSQLGVDAGDATIDIQQLIAQLAEQIARERRQVCGRYRLFRSRGEALGPLRQDNAVLRHKAAHVVDERGARVHQPVSHAVYRL